MLSNSPPLKINSELELKDLASSPSRSKRNLQIEAKAEVHTFSKLTSATHASLKPTGKEDIKIILGNLIALYTDQVNEKK